jgi:hypothetical protein
MSLSLFYYVLGFEGKKRGCEVGGGGKYLGLDVHRQPRHPPPSPTSSRTSRALQVLTPEKGGGGENELTFICSLSCREFDVRRWACSTPGRVGLILARPAT